MKKLKILYISPENTVGTLQFWKRAHELNGHQCRYVTFYRSSGGYEEDICLDLPFLSSSQLYLKWRNWVSRKIEKKDPYADIGGNPPVWQPPLWQKILFRLREFIWYPKIKRAIKKYDLENFDIYHFEWGLDFFRNAAFAKKMKAKGKKIICHYHGQDMRNRGVIPAMDAITDLNLTNELDLTFRHPNIHYSFLPFDVLKFQASTKLNSPITICHATTNWVVKGTEKIIEVCRKLEKSHNIRFIFIENMPNDEVLKLKAQSDIYIDQITDHAPGYGMNSLEALSMGVACVTYLNQDFLDFLTEHPFINANGDNLEEELIRLIENPDELSDYREKSRQWVEEYHDFRNVVQKIYDYYRQYLNIEI